MANFALVSNCQNWVTSQALRDPKAVAPPREVTPGQMVQIGAALRREARRVELQRAADHERMGGRYIQAGETRGLRLRVRINGNATPEVLDYIRPWTDLYKID